MTWRVIALVLLDDGPWRTPLFDDALYIDWARNLARGVDVPGAYEFPPAWAFVLAALFAITKSLFVARVLCAVMGTLTVCLLADTARVLAKGRASFWLAGALGTFCGPLVLYSVVLLKTALLLLAVALTLRLLLAAPRRARAIALGVSVALAVLTQGHALGLIPLVLLALWPHRTHLLLFVLALLFALAPAAIKSSLASGSVVMLPTQAGFNLFIGATSPTPNYTPLPFASSDPRVQAAHFHFQAERALGATLTPREANAYWRQRALDEALSRPLRPLQNAHAALYRKSEHDHYDLDLLAKDVGVFHARVGFGLLGALFAFALLTLTRRELFVLGGLGLSFVFMIALSYSGARYRVPIALPLIVGVAVGLPRLRARLPRWPRALVALGVLALVFVPAPGAYEVSGAHNVRALVALRTGALDEAEHHWGLSVDAGGRFSVYAQLALAQRAMTRGDVAAFAKLSEIPAGTFAEADRQALLGRHYQQRGRLRDAHDAYARALAINGGLYGVRQAQIALLEALDKNAASVAQREQRALTRVLKIAAPFAARR